MPNPHLTVIYPSSEGASFDHHYWQGTHKSLVHQHMGKGLKSVVFLKGLSAPDGGTPAALAIANLEYDSMDDLKAAVASAGPVVEDIKNYTNIAPQMMVAEDI